MHTMKRNVSIHYVDEICSTSRNNLLAEYKPKCKQMDVAEIHESNKNNLKETSPLIR